MAMASEASFSPQNDEAEKLSTDDNCIAIEQLIAELCVDAPTETIKVCLRQYQYGRTIMKIQSSLSKSKLDDLIETGKYLKIKYQPEDLLKADLVHEIICRIQNLLPDTCSLCSTKYKVGIDDTPFLECASCGQGCHNKCWQQLINIKS